MEGSRLSSTAAIYSFLRSIAPRDPQIRGATAVALIFFSASLVVFTVSGILRGDYSPRDIYQIGVPMMVVDGLIAFQLVFLLRFASRFHPFIKWAIMLVGVLVVAALQSAWDTQLRIWAGTVARDYGTAYLAFIRAGTLNVYHSGLFVALLAFQASNLELRQKERQLRRARAGERDAHMLALRYQLNPHFLFNTLNGISSLMIVGRTDEAEEMIDRLSSFLRSSLTADPRSLVRVDEEFEMLETYLDIESVRFGERLVTEMELPVDLADALVPPFLLQPIVENAMKYAVAPASRPVDVKVEAEEQAGQLVLRVTDDGEGCEGVASGTGIGLANVRQRLRLRYGERASLDKHQDENGCRVEIRLPLSHDDYRRTVGGGSAAAA
jgi:hypothetical protein